MRLGSLETPVPFNPTLEQSFLGRARLADTLDRLLSF
jgi:hypothetical protein